MQIHGLSKLTDANIILSVDARRRLSCLPRQKERRNTEIGYRIFQEFSNSKEDVNNDKNWPASIADMNSFTLTCHEKNCGVVDAKE